jgi:hypothetical protein
MAAKIKTELAVGITEEIKNALEIAIDFYCMKPSQYGRHARGIFRASGQGAPGKFSAAIRN